MGQSYFSPNAKDKRMTLKYLGSLTKTLRTEMETGIMLLLL